MRVLSYPPTGVRRRLCLAIGVFDGVHRGHQAIISQAVRLARRTGALPAVLTFEPHPGAVLSPESPPPLLTTTEEKMAALRTLGIRLVVIAGFDRALADMPPEDFVKQILAGRLRARCLVVGEGWRFGRGGKGTPALLSEMGPSAGFSVASVAPVVSGGRKVSSTHIRGLLRRGRVSAAADLLGRPYQLSGEVVSGAALGRRLGRPTANLTVPAEKLLPADGVYAAHAAFGPGSRPRRLHPAVAYIGTRPTIAPHGERAVEVHLLDLPPRSSTAGKAAHPGRTLRVAFIARLRGDRRFPSREALAAQMSRDCSRARRRLAALQTPGDML